MLSKTLPRLKHVALSSTVFFAIALLLFGLFVNQSHTISPAQAVTTYKLRQEINIITGIVTAAGDDRAVVQLTTTQYSGTPTYYFESVAQVASGTLTLTLQRLATTTVDATISVTATSFTRQRVAFTPPAGSTQYNINLSGGTTPQVKAARIIVVQTSNGLSSTETQIEIGNLEINRSNTGTVDHLSYPKYWYYDSARWDGTVTFYAEVTSRTTSTNTRTIVLQQDDGNFANWTTAVTIVSAVTGTTAARTRSAAFTPVSGRNYRIAGLTSSTSQRYDVYNAKIIVQQAGAITTLEPQYLVANTAPATGNSLQNFDNYYDPADWSGVTNTYYHEVNGTLATPDYVTFGSSAGASSATCTVTRPTRLNVDDLMVAHVSSRVGGTAITTPVTPGTWTQIQQTNQSTLIRAGMFYRVATAADLTTTSYAFTVGTEANRCAISVIRAPARAGPIGASNAQANAAPASPFTQTVGGITPNTTDSLILLAFSSADDNTHGTWAIATSDPGMTERYDVATTSGSDTSLALAARTRPAATATGNGTAVQATNGGDANVGFLVSVSRESYSDFKLQSNPNGTPADITNGQVNNNVNRQRSSALTMPGSAQEIDLIGVNNQNNTFGSRIIVQTVLDPSTINISGNAYNAATGTTAWTGCNGTDARISLVINGGTASTTSCNASTGAYTFSNVSVPSNANITVFFNTTNGNTDRAAAYQFLSVPTADITGLNVRRTRVELYSTGINNTGLSHCQSGAPAQCANMPFAVSSGDVTTTTGIGIHINTGASYDPQGDVTTTQLHLNGTFDPSVSLTLRLTGSGGGANIPLYLDTGYYFDAPTVVEFAGSTGGATDIANEFYIDVVIDGTDTFSVNSYNTISGNLEIRSGTFRQYYTNYNIGSNGVTNSGSIRVDSDATYTTVGDFVLYSNSSNGGANCIGGLGATCTGDNGVMVLPTLLFGNNSTDTTTTINANNQQIASIGEILIEADATVSLNGSMYVADSFAVNGTFIPNSSTLTMGASYDGGASIILNGSPLYNLVVDDSGSGATINLTTSALTVNNDLTITGGTFDVGTSNQAVSIGRNFSNSDIFNARSGTVSFVGSSNSTITTGCGNVDSCTNNDLYALVINKSSSSATVTQQTNHVRLTNNLSVTQGVLVQSAQNIRVDGTTTIGANGEWRNISAGGDIALTTSLSNAGIVTWANSNGCGGSNDIAITAVSGTPAWSGAGTFDLRDVTISNQNATVAITAYSSTDGGGNTGSWSFNSGCGGGVLTVDIVDSGGTPVSSPSVAMANKNVTLLYQSSTGTLGTSSERIRATNTTGNPLWTMSIAATDGATAFWDGSGSNDYDFNDGTASAGDGGDADSLGGQMTINPSAGTLSPQGGCSNTGLSLGSSTAFNQQTPLNSITLVSTTGSAQTGCYWDLTGVGISQTIPAQMPVGSYTINLTISIIAN